MASTESSHCKLASFSNEGTTAQRRVDSLKTESMQAFSLEATVLAEQPSSET